MSENQKYTNLIWKTWNIPNFTYTYFNNNREKKLLVMERGEMLFESVAYYISMAYN